jgi:hypothetical protein
MDERSLQFLLKVSLNSSSTTFFATINKKHKKFHQNHTDVLRLSSEYTEKGNIKL